MATSAFVTSSLRPRLRPANLGSTGGLGSSLRPQARPDDLTPNTRQGNYVDASQYALPDIRPKRYTPSIQKNADDISAFLLDRGHTDNYAYGGRYATPQVGGLPEADVDKLIRLESGNQGYTASNKSGAYGRYQFMPDTAKQYADKLGISMDEWKRPENQDKMFAAFTQDNINQLKARGMPIDLFHVYGAHQQGVGGLSKILANKLDAETIRNMRSNVTKEYKHLQGQDLRNAWLKLWKSRTRN